MGPVRAETSEVRQGASQGKSVSKTKFKTNCQDKAKQNRMALSFSDTLNSGLQAEKAQSTGQRNPVIGQSSTSHTAQRSQMDDEFPALGASGTTSGQTRVAPKQTQPGNAFKFEPSSGMKTESTEQIQSRKNTFQSNPSSSMITKHPGQTQSGNHAFKFESPSGMRTESIKQTQPGNYAFKFETPPSSASMTSVANVRKRNLNQMGYKDLVDWLKNPNHVYIGRNMTHYVPGAVGSKWGNPFKNMEREECCRRYKKYIETDKKIQSNGRTLLQSLDELKGKTLGCWCHPEKCHGHMLVELIEEYGVDL